MSSDDPRDDDFWRRPGDRVGPEDEVTGDVLGDDPTWNDDVHPVWHDDVPLVNGQPPEVVGVAASEVAGGDPQPPRGPSRLQRLSGTVAVAALLVVALLFFVTRGSGSGTPVPATTPTPTPTITPVVIPDEARTKIFTTDTPASNEFRLTTLIVEPATTAKTTNPYTVRVESTANVDADEVARFIQKVLDDPRSWAGFGNNNFRLVHDREQAKLTITIASPTTTDALCGAPDKTKKVASCRVKDQIVINSDRWHYMVPTYNNIDEYRAYVVNHFTGQFLGQRLAFCTKQGEPAPAMAQQDANLGGCLPNAWPKLS